MWLREWLVGSYRSTTSHMDARSLAATCLAQPHRPTHAVDRIGCSCITPVPLLTSSYPALSYFCFLGHSYTPPAFISLRSAWCTASTLRLYASFLLPLCCIFAGILGFALFRGTIDPIRPDSGRDSPRVVCIMSLHVYETGVWFAMVFWAIVSVDTELCSRGFRSRICSGLDRLLS